MVVMLGIGGMSLGSEVDVLNVFFFLDIVVFIFFILELFNVYVIMLDGEVDIIFVVYFDEQKVLWWGVVMGLFGVVIGGVKFFFFDKEEEEGNRLDFFYLIEDQVKKVEVMCKVIIVDVDKKIGIIIVMVILQDLMVMVVIIDMVVVKFQEYIIVYRVFKVQQDCVYLE